MVVANMGVNLGVLCTSSIDIDAVVGWLSSYAGANSTSDISCKMFAGIRGDSGC